MSAETDLRAGIGGAPTRAWWLLLAIAVPVFFLSLSANSIWDANEAFYVDTPRQMIQSGDYVTPVFNGEWRLNKPVLSYWIVAAFYHLFGVSVTTERVAIALGTMGILAAAFLIGRALRSTSTGILAALIVATAPRVVMWSRRIFIDIYITMFMSLTLACFVLAERHPEHRRRYLLLMYVCIGLGVLTKGPVALVLPALVGGIWLMVEGRVTDLKRLHLPIGLAIVTAIVAPWYVALYLRHGWGPITSFFVGENVGRFTSEMAGDRPWWFYGPVLFGDLFPWAPLLILPLLSVWRRRPSDGGRDGLHRLLWLWIMVIVLLFSFSRTKQDLYIFPVIAAVAGLVADTIEAADFGRLRASVRVWLAVVAGVSAAGGLAAFRLFGAGIYAMQSVGTVAVLLASAGLAAIVFLVIGRGRSAVMTLALGFVAFNYVFVIRTLPSLERLKPVVPIAQLIAERAEPTAQLGSYHLLLPSLVFYAGRPVETLGLPEQARSFFFNDRGGWAIMGQQEFDELRGLVSGLCVADRRPFLDFRLSDVLAQRPPPNVLLVTNRCQGLPGPPASN